MKKILLAVSLLGFLGVAVANNFGGGDDKDKKSCSSKKEGKACCSKKNSKSCSKDGKSETPETKPTQDKK